MQLVNGVVSWVFFYLDGGVYDVDEPRAGEVPYGAGEQEEA